MHESPLIDRRTCVLWIAVCSVASMLSPLPSLAWQVEVSPAQPLTPLLLAISVCLALPPVLYHLVLRRIAPALRASSWTGVWLIVGMLMLCNALFLWQPGMQYAFAVRALAYNGITVESLLGLPWWRPAVALLVAMCILAPPCLLVARASGRKWTMLLAAATLATCFEQTTGAICWLFWGPAAFTTFAGSWDRIAIMLFFNGTLGAIWGAASAAALATMERQRGATPFAWQYWGPTAALVLLAPAVLYFSQQGAAAQLRDALRKAVTFAPATDHSTGSAIVRLSHQADIAPGNYPYLRFSPDSITVIALSRERTLEHIEVATGKHLGTLGTPLSQSQRFDVDWSPDGKLLALRTEADVINANRYRLFSVPDLVQLADHTYDTAPCIPGYQQQMLFTAYSRHLWVSCGSDSAPIPEEAIAAIRLAVPSLQPEATHYYGERAQRGKAEPLLRSHAGILYLQRGTRDEDPVYLYNLDLDRHIRVGDDLRSAQLAGGLTFQEAVIQDQRLEMRYCGRAAQVADPGHAEHEAHDVHAFCRTLLADPETGAITGKRDAAGSTRHDSTLSSPDGTLVVEASWSASSKTGQTIVRDAASGRELQRLETLAQSPAGFSPDGRWLVTKAVDRPVLRFYALRQ
jgi:hypothetical protein